MQAVSFLFGCLIGVPMAATALATPNNDYRVVDRYSLVTLAPTAEQQNILSAIIHIEFDGSIKTVGMAVQAILRDSGYALADAAASDPKMHTLLSSPLPRVHQALGPVRLDDALRTLAGSAWVLVMDRVHRRISFEVADAYTACTQATAEETCQ